MKKILSIITCVTALLCLSHIAKAQSAQKISLSVGPELAFPLSARNQQYGFEDEYNAGLGASAKLEVPFANYLSFTASAGFLWYHAEHALVFYDEPANPPSGVNNQPDKPIYPESYRIIPVTIGLKYSPVKYFYLSGDLGEAIKADSVARNAFLWSGGLGFIVPFSAKQSLDIGASYEHISRGDMYTGSFGQIAFRVAYRFGL